MLALWIVLGLAGLAVVVYLLDRLLLALERRGWIYYRKTRNDGSNGGLWAGMMQVQKLLEPASRHVISVKEEKRVDQERRDAPGGSKNSEPR